MPSPDHHIPVADASRQAYYYPNKMGRIVLQSLEEILGQTGIKALLKRAQLDRWINAYPANNLDMGFHFEDMGRIHSSLEELYGPLSGRGLALRAGRMCFKYGLNEFWPMAAESNLTFRLLPLNMKLIVGAGAFASLFNRYSDQVVHVAEEKDRILWHIERCPFCWGRQTDAPCCHLAVGLLQESLYWVSGGKNFAVDEIKCIARGDARCTIHIVRKPLD